MSGPVDGIDWAALNRGHCSRALAAESGCPVCTRAYEVQDQLRAIVEAAERYYEASTTIPPPCTGPHDGRPCFDCFTVGEARRFEREAAQALRAALDAAGSRIDRGPIEAFDDSRGPDLAVEEPQR